MHRFGVRRLAREQPSTVDDFDNDYEGWYLDDLTIHDGETPPIPEPSTWLLLSTGLLGVGAAARKRFFG